MFEVSLFGQSLCGVENLTAADTGSPNAYVVGILQFGEVGKESVLVQIVHFFLAAQRMVARQGDNLHAGSHHEESHIETDLVVAGTRRAVCDGIGTNLLGIAGNGDSLEDALRTDGDGVTVVAQHIAENHILQRLLVVFLRHVERHIFLCTQLVGVFFVLLQLFSAETASIGAGCIHFITVVLQFHHGVTSVQSAGKGYHYFLLICHNIYCFLFLFFQCLPSLFIPCHQVF